MPARWAAGDGRPPVQERVRRLADVHPLRPLRGQLQVGGQPDVERVGLGEVGQSCLVVDPAAGQTVLAGQAEPGQLGRGGKRGGHGPRVYDPASPGKTQKTPWLLPIWVHALK